MTDRNQPPIEASRFGQELAPIAAWAQDFACALNERPIWAKWLFRFVVGRYAYREFFGLLKALEDNGNYPYWGYMLEENNYHKDPLPTVWWRNE